MGQSAAKPLRTLSVYGEGSTTRWLWAGGLDKSDERLRYSLVPPERVLCRSPSNSVTLGLVGESKGSVTTGGNTCKRLVLTTTRRTLLS